MSEVQMKGFTLIELIVVITILGILAAVAAPKFVSLQSDARQAVMEGVEASVRGAATLVYSKALVQGKESQASGQTVTVEGSNVDLIYGYPAAAALDSVLTRDGTNTDSNIKVGTAAAGVITITYNNISGCEIEYTEATASSPPDIATDYSSC